MASKLTTEQRRVQRGYKLLYSVIDDAAAWRGQYVGRPDAEEVLAAFDRRTAKARIALRDIANLAFRGE